MLTVRPLWGVLWKGEGGTGYCIAPLFPSIRDLKSCAWFGLLEHILKRAGAENWPVFNGCILLLLVLSGLWMVCGWIKVLSCPKLWHCTAGGTAASLRKHHLASMSTQDPPFTFFFRKLYFLINNLTNLPLLQVFFFLERLPIFKCSIMLLLLGVPKPRPKSQHKYPQSPVTSFWESFDSAHHCLCIYASQLIRWSVAGPLYGRVLWLVKVKIDQD